mgnify:CR=1 FL=1
MKESSSYIQPARSSSAGSSGPVRAYGSRMSSSCFCVIQNQRSNTLARLQRFLCNRGRFLVSDIRAERRCDADTLRNEILAPFLICGNAENTVLHKRIHSACHRGDGREQGVEDNRFKRVQLHLASLSRHRDCGVVSDDMEGNLCHNLRDNRVDLARHNRGSVLHRRQVDLAESGPRSAGQQAQVVAHLGEVDGL